MDATLSVLKDLLGNLRAGLRIALLRPFDAAQLQVDARQTVLLMVVALGLGATSDFLHVEPVREFNIWGIVSTLATFTLFLLSVYLVAQIHGQLDRLAVLVVALLATEPVGQGLAEIYRYTLNATMRDGSEWLAWSAFALLMGWYLAVCYRIQRQLFASRRWRSAFAASVYIGVSLLNSFLLPHVQMWYTADNGEETAFPAVDVEATYYAQPKLLDAALQKLQAQRPGIPDIYFVGMAGWAEQDVFMREVRSVQQQFDARFDTQGRSLLLINNPTTLADIPLANASNLQLALGRIAELMDPQEDLLFLYVTSHGSQEQEVAMYYQPLSLNDISAARLDEILKSSGIRWRAVVLSACYSGGFIPSLQNATTMVLTASAADRQSFGCSNENAWTYFGEAYFDQALAHTYSFTSAFQEAAREIAARESREQIEPSRPQAWVGEEIAQYLPRLERRLAGLHSEVPQGGAECRTNTPAVSMTCR